MSVRCIPDASYDMLFSSLSIPELNAMDVVFLAVPHGKAKPIVSELETKVIDMTGDHRLTHTYGIPELFGSDIKEASIVANPGCYATACILAAYPLKDYTYLAVFDCISGYSGAGKNCSFDHEDNMIAYKLMDHFHNYEIKKVLGTDVSFTPHVVDTFAGIMCTAHLYLDEKVDVDSLYDCYSGFVQVVSKLPCTKDVVGTPYCHIAFEVKGDEVVVVSVIDNLMKGAASQAIQNMNIMFGLEPEEGLK